MSLCDSLYYKKNHILKISQKEFIDLLHDKSPTYVCLGPLCRHQFAHAANTHWTLVFLFVLCVKFTPTPSHQFLHWKINWH